MTRKRFCKLLMARRWTRDEAAQIAKNVYAYGRKKTTYRGYYRFVCVHLQNGRV